MPRLVVVVASQKGGSGKTTCALNLGTLATMDGATILLDCDPQGSLEFWSDRRDCEIPVVRTANLAALKGDIAAAQAPEYVFVDTPPHAFAGISTAIEAADLVVVPVRPTALDLHAAEATLSLAAALAKRTMVVLTQCQPPRLFNEAPSVREARSILAKLGCRVASQAIVQRLSIEQSVAVGRSVGEFEPNGAADLEFRNLWRELKIELRPPRPRAGARGKNA